MLLSQYEFLVECRAKARSRSVVALLLFPLQPFLFFFGNDYTIPQTFAVTSEHIRLFTFYFLVFFCFYTFLVVGSVR